MIPEWFRLYAVAAIIGGLAGIIARTILEEVRLSRLVREKLGPTEYHHKLPLYLGGNSLPENLEVVHPKCHRRRHRRMPGKGNHSRKRKAEATASQSLLCRWD